LQKNSTKETVLCSIKERTQSVLHVLIGSIKESELPIKTCSIKERTRDCVVLYKRENTGNSLSFIEPIKTCNTDQHML